MRTFAAVLLCAAAVQAAGLKAGVGRADITPDGPIWMSGYAARTHPSDGVAMRLFAKALALETSARGRIVIVTTDVVGIPRTVADDVTSRAAKQYGLQRSQVLLNASHTHTGPVVWPNLSNMAVLPEAEREKLIAYSHKFADGLVAAIGQAMHDLSPATIEYGQGTATFAVNRREPTPTGVKIGVNPNGPVDHSVPVLRIKGPDGKLRAILFAYACHNTTLTAEIYQLSGDYAGFAQAALEQQHPGATAMFLMLCGADQNPNPRNTVELGRQHGTALAAEVDRVLTSPMKPIGGPIRTAFRLTTLDFAPRTRQDFEAETKSTIAAQARRARLMLDALDAGKKVGQLEYPIQAIRFGKDLTLVALGGEVVVGYDLRIHREFPGEPLIAAGYSNDVMCYIPTATILKEGGYEAVDSMFYYAQPGPFAPDVEERIMKGVHETMKMVGR